MANLYSISSATFLIGTLLNNPKLLLTGKYKLEGEDFAPNLYHRTLFWAIRMLTNKGVSEIDEITLDNFVKDYETYYETLNDNNFMSTVSTFKQISLEGTIDYHFDVVKKFSCLRYYKDNGYDTTKFFDESKEEASQNENLNKYEISDIINYYEGINAQANTRFTSNSNILEYKAGEDFLDTIDYIKSGGLIGDSFQSQFINTIFNGMYGFILRSGGSGDGKTLSYVGDMMTVGCTHYWDENVQDFVKNKCFVGATMMINSELDLKKELEPMLIAWITNIDRGKIRKWNVTNEEETRILKAREILNESPIYLIDDAQFTIKSLTSTITKYHRDYGIKNVYFDYLNTNGYIDAELAQEAKIPQRQDTVLQTATDRLKALQRSLGIGLLSGTQLNSKNQERDSTPNATWLAGGQSQERKADGVMIMNLPTKKELEAYGVYKEKKYKQGFSQSIEPNRVTHIIKGRNSEFPKYIKVFHYLDTGTCRNTDLLVLTQNNMPIQIERMVIENE